MVAPGGVCVVAVGGMSGFFGGACMVFPFFQGGTCVVALEGCVVFPGGACIGYDKIRSMSGWYASYWNAFLLFIQSETVYVQMFVNCLIFVI